MIRRYYIGIMFVYTLVLLYMMFFGLGRQASEGRWLQINPFQTIAHFCGSHIKGQDFFLNIIGNIFVFSPFGWIGISIRKFNKIAPLTLLFIFFIGGLEFIQYQTGRGTADIDDLLLNTSGMLLGYGLMQTIMHANIFSLKTYFNLERPIAIQTY